MHSSHKNHKSGFLFFFGYEWILLGAFKVIGCCLVVGKVSLVLIQFGWVVTTVVVGWGVIVTDCDGVRSKGE